MEKSFFARDTREVAKDLIGCILEKDSIRGRIVETEAYMEEDPACHAYPEKTSRNRLMYETHGKVYVYLCYGIHHMLNFTTEKENAGGVLIRAVEPLKGVEKMRENREVQKDRELCNGPGKICEALDIDKDLKGTEVGERIKLERCEAEEVEVSKRIGITKAVDRELRFFEPGNIYVSNQ